VQKRDVLCPGAEEGQMRYLGVAFKLVRGGLLVVVGWMLWM
jgi:hypothetical protein